MAESEIDVMETANAVNIDESGNKRKGSPLSKADVKKLLSEGGAVGTVGSERKSSLRRQNSVPDLHKVMVSAKDKKGGGGIAFSDMVKMTFREPTFAKSITPLLYDMMRPLILKTIETSVAATLESKKISNDQELI